MASPGTRPTTRLRTIVVDDEPLARESLEVLLRRHEDLDIVATCANGAEAIEAIEAHRPDLVFLDVIMPELDGFDVLDQVSDLPVVIFVTAHEDFAIRAFESHAVDYVLKPYTEGRLDAAISRARQWLEGLRLSRYRESMLEALAGIRDQERDTRERDSGDQLDRIMVKHADVIRWIDSGDIHWIEGADDYVWLHTAEQDYLYRERLKNLELRLDPDRFVRVHLSSIVNLDHVKELKARTKDDYVVILNSGRELNVSRSRKKSLFAWGQKRFGFRA